MNNKELELEAEAMNVSELKPNYIIYGNRGNVWNNTAHIYKSGVGNMCGTPALATNWAQIENIQTIGCPECIEKYNVEMDREIELQFEYMSGAYEE